MSNSKKELAKITAQKIENANMYRDAVTGLESIETFIFDIFKDGGCKAREAAKAADIVNPIFATPEGLPDFDSPYGKSVIMNLTAEAQQILAAHPIYKFRTVSQPSDFVNDSRVSEDGEWTDESERISFHDFKANPVFEGTYIGETCLVDGNGLEVPDGECFLFQYKTGLSIYVNPWYSLRKVIDGKGDEATGQFFRITYLGNDPIKGTNKTFTKLGIQTRIVKK